MQLTLNAKMENNNIILQQKKTEFYCLRLHSNKSSIPATLLGECIFDYKLCIISWIRL